MSEKEDEREAELLCEVIMFCKRQGKISIRDVTHCFHVSKGHAMRLCKWVMDSGEVKLRRDWDEVPSYPSDKRRRTQW